MVLRKLSLALLRGIFVVLFLADVAHSGVNTWTRTNLYGNCCSSFVFAPLKASLVWGYNQDGQVYKSIDFGRSWKILPFHPASGKGFALRIPAADPSRVFALATPNLWSSSDGGVTWQGIASVPALAFSQDLEFDSRNPAIIYAGGAIVDSDAQVTAVFRSTNGGKDWTKVLTDGEGRVMQIEVDPLIAGIVYARSARSIFKSSDSGNTWNRNDAIPNGTTAFIIDPTDGNILYAAAGDVYKSTDGGVTWSGLHSEITVTSIAVDRNHHDTIYVAGIEGLKKSTDGGGSWESIPVPYASFGSPPWTVAVSPLDGGLVFAWNLYRNTLRSADGGRTFQLIPRGASSQTYTVRTLRQSAGKMLAGPNQLFRTDDFGKSWHDLDLGIALNPNAGLIDFQIHPLDDHLIYALVEKDQISYIGRSQDGGHTWNLSRIAENVLSFALQPDDPNTIYVSQYRRILKSTDGGLNWALLAQDFLPRRLALVAAHPSKSNILFASFQGNAIYRSTDFGGSWRLSSSGIPRSQSGAGLRLGFDPSRSNVIFAYGLTAFYKSVDYGVTWLRSDQGLNLRETGSHVTSFTPQPGQPGVFFLTGEEFYGPPPHLFISTDDAKSWRPFLMRGLPKDIGLGELAISPAAPNLYFLGTDAGVFTFTNALNP